MKLYTTRQAAGILCKSHRCVQYWCWLLGFDRTGRDYILTEEDMQIIRVRAVGMSPGRPRKS